MTNEIEEVSNSAVRDGRKAALFGRNSADWVTLSARLIGHRFEVQASIAPGDSALARARAVGRAA